MEQILESLSKIPNYENYFYAAIMLLNRFIGFVTTAPILSRKDIPTLVKLSIVICMTATFVPLFRDTTPPPEMSFFMGMLLNFVFGLLVGFIARVIFETIVAAGEMANMQMGMQSSMMFDRSAGSQVSVIGKFFTHFGMVIFMHIGGLFWIFLAFKRGFDIFPLYGSAIPLQEIVNLDYMIFLTGNVLFIGLQFAAPIVITTLCQDLILGIISKIAPQINVFQLSFLFKPITGVLILLIILPLLTNTIIEYFHYYSQIY